MIDDDSRFELIRRGGWITTQPYMTYRKKSIQMFREGSVFSLPKTRAVVENSFKAGKTVDLRPELPEGMKQVEHPVWRVGKSIFIPVNL
jgi:CRISPR/Cas system CSM-associated protein Csm4 (group 5 of RAMP superfamily)